MNCNLYINRMKRRNNFASSSSDSKRRRIVKDAIPLINIGANCYLNSALQGISSCKQYVEDIKKLSNSRIGCNKLIMFNELLQVLSGNSSKEKCLEISKNPIFDNWNKTGQQDSFEIISYILNEVYNEIRNVDTMNLKTWVGFKLPLKICFKYKIQCDCGNEPSSVEQFDYALHLNLLPVTNKMKYLRLTDLIDHHFKKELIQDYECENEECNDNNKAYRIMKLLKNCDGTFPTTLCIHLQRNHWNVSKNIMEKLDSKVKFDPILEVDFKKYSDYDDCNEKKVLKYELACIITHVGSYIGGHYICYKKFDDRWILANDAYVQEVNLKEVLNGQAYILFYEKK